MSWPPIRAAIVAGANELIKDFSSVHSAQDLVAVASKALWSYPNPVVTATSTAVLVALLTFVLSVPTNNYSWVDKSWSILPAYYAWHFALHGLKDWSAINPRLLAMAVVATVWGARLTYNFARKGGYRWSGEDYR
jgi:steroid 5-alpha reductase family enzyme